MPAKLFSVGVDRLLQEVRPYGRGSTSFPRTLIEADARRDTDEPLHQWFVRVVDRFCGGEPKRTAIEDNIAVFVKLSWANRTRLSYASIQTVVATFDLDDYYIDGVGESVYLRLDFDYTTLGEPFSHPLAHIHTEGSLSPRFALDGGTSGNIVVDYLEFLYRNYVPAKWRTWAEQVWNFEFAQSAGADDVNPFPIICEAFSSGQFQVLRDYSVDLARIKRTLRRRKDEYFDFHMHGADREMLEYPLAR
jgi:hypothetical protein